MAARGLRGGNAAACRCRARPGSRAREGWNGRGVGKGVSRLPRGGGPAKSGVITSRGAARLRAGGAPVSLENGRGVLRGRLRPVLRTQVTQEFFELAAQHRRIVRSARGIGHVGHEPAVHDLPIRIVPNDRRDRVEVDRRLPVRRSFSGSSRDAPSVHAEVRVVRGCAVKSVRHGPARQALPQANVGHIQVHLIFDLKAHAVSYARWSEQGMSPMRRGLRLQDCPRRS